MEKIGRRPRGPPTSWSVPPERNAGFASHTHLGGQHQTKLILQISKQHTKPIYINRNAALAIAVCARHRSRPYPYHNHHDPQIVRITPSVHSRPIRPLTGRLD